jgi:adenine-specific DNA-methyltransferase
MSREILRQIIEDFSPEKFINFFRIKNPNFRPLEINLGIENEDFSLSKKIGEVQLEDNNIIFCTFKVLKELTEKSGKKKQYEIGKKVLKNENADAGIFIFYDRDNRFRFSLIYTEYFGTKRKFSHFKRFTYFVSKDQTNNTFLRQVGDGDFSSLEKIKEAFSVEPITKEFYKEIQTWFFTALDKIRFTDNKEETKPLHLIRLLSRLIFIWFIKQKGLIPDKIFDQGYLKEIVKDFNVSQNSCNYYNAILQNLFFATLNQPIKDRGWAFNRGFPENKNTYGIKQLYRYEDKFLISPEKVMEIFSEIPFINGGLFDCLDKEDEDGKVIYIDGFSREEKRQTKIPDYLFFSEEIKTDLSKYQIKSNQKARGLINILKSYNFTIDEATPIDQEVALDPELLGKIFENLLAVYNPETATTARKTTGSYYTPREIVEYMVHQSLLEYFKNKLPEITEEKLDLLLSYSDEEIDLEEKQKEKIVEIISEIKIIDPACGSGAFPMGILSKLVYVLGKIDPKNEYWKKIQIRKLKEELKKLSEKDEKEIEEHFKELEETFNENLFYPDYARKLYLIENCIFGVDIQQIATQLSKLRFFISLIIDQKVDKNKENFGIIPLPNLDLKFITANSLIGLGIKKDIQLTLFKDEKIQKLFNDIKEQYHRYFRAKLRGDKKKIKDKIEQLEKNLADSLKSTIKIEKKREIEQLSSQAKKIQEEIEKIKLEPEQFQVIEQKRLFGKTMRLSIDLKQGKIQSKLKELREINKKIEEIKKVISGDILKQVAKKILAFKPFDPNYSNPWFEPEWTFGVSDGFDIVIANPPYIGEKGHRNIFEEIKNSNLGEFYQGKMDLFYFFFHLALNLSKEGGIISFITTNYYLTATGAKKLREDFYKRALIKKLINFNELKIFESALGQHNMITILQKGNNKNVFAETCITKRQGFAKPEILKKIFSGEDRETIYYKVSQKDLYDGSEYYIRISGVSNFSDNPIQKILEKIKMSGVPLGNVCNINTGIQTGADKVSRKHIEKYKINANIGDGIFVLSNEEVERLNLTEKEKEILKPWFKNSDIYRYVTIAKTNQNILYINRDTKTIGNNIKEHLKHYEKILEERREAKNNVIQWWQLQWPRNQSFFDGPKIVAPQRSPRNTFGYNEIPWYASADVYFITEKDSSISLKYILALLNSKLYYLWFYYRGKKKGENLELYQKPLSEVPIKKISKDKQKPFIDIVDKILSLKNQNPKADTTEYEKQIDQLVYKLYNLTEDEIKIIENYE